MLSEDTQWTVGGMCNVIFWCLLQINDLTKMMRLVVNQNSV